MGGEHGRRLSPRERSEIRARIAAGETHWEAAEAVDCSAKTVQRLPKEGVYRMSGGRDDAGFPALQVAADRPMMSWVRRHDEYDD